jgi:hypothetical protein
VADFFICCLVDFDGSLRYPVHFFEEFLSERVAVINQTFSSKYDNSIADYEVLGCIKLLLFQAHAWIMSIYGNLW